jgi:hypothetical protein
MSHAVLVSAQDNVVRQAVNWNDPLGTTGDTIWDIITSDDWYWLNFMFSDIVSLYKEWNDLILVGKEHNLTLDIWQEMPLLGFFEE